MSEKISHGKFPHHIASPPRGSLHVPPVVGCDMSHVASKTVFPTPSPVVCLPRPQALCGWEHTQSAVPGHQNSITDLSMHQVGASVHDIQHQIPVVLVVDFSLQCSFNSAIFHVALSEGKSNRFTSLNVGLGGQRLTAHKRVYSKIQFQNSKTHPNSELKTQDLPS